MSPLSLPPSAHVVLPRPYLLFLGDIAVPAFAKTAFGLRDWARDSCLGEWSLPGCSFSLGLPRLAPAAARAAGAASLVIGAAAPGGQIADSWIAALLEALEAGLDVISGMHTRLGTIPALATAAARHGRRLIDVRVPPADLPIATGLKRAGRRLLTIGTDCAVGKKYTALALTRAFAARGLAADFRATGQTGILIAGAGMPIDATVCDFTAGAAERLSPEAAPDHWDVIEGQGSLFHPAYAGVSLALLHGSQPDVVVLCHESGRDRVLGAEAFPIPALREALDLTLALGRRTNPRLRCAGLSLNCGALSEAEAEAQLAAAEAETALPAADPIRGGARFARLVDACLAR